MLLPVYNDDIWYRYFVSSFPGAHSSRAVIISLCHPHGLNYQTDRQWFRFRANFQKIWEIQHPLTIILSAVNFTEAIFEILENVTFQTFLWVKKIGQVCQDARVSYLEARVGAAMRTVEGKKSPCPITRSCFGQNQNRCPGCQCSVTSVARRPSATGSNLTAPKCQKTWTLRRPMCALVLGIQAYHFWYAGTGTGYLRC